MTRLTLCFCLQKVTEENKDQDEKDIVLNDENTTDNDDIDNSSCNEKSSTVTAQDLGFVHDLTNNIEHLTFYESINKKNKLKDSSLIFKKLWLSSKVKYLFLQFSYFINNICYIVILIFCL